MCGVEPPDQIGSRRALVSPRAGLTQRIAAPWIILGAAIALALLVGLEVYRQNAAAERAHLEREADLHAKRLSDHLLARENIVRAVAATLGPDDPIRASVLAPFDTSLMSSLGDVTSLVWVARATASDEAAILATLAARGRNPPAIFGLDRRPVDLGDPRRELEILLDIEPKTPANLAVLGFDLNALPSVRAALDAALAANKAVASAPMEIAQAPGEPSTVVYAPVFEAAEESLRHLGFVGMSFRYGPVIAAALGSDVPGRWRVRDTGDPVRRTLAQSAPLETFSGDRPLSRRVAFAGRVLAIEFVAPASTRPFFRGLLAGLGVLGAGVAAFAVTMTLTRARARAEAATAAHARAEADLAVVARELDHRVRNVLSVAQALVHQTLRHGAAENVGSALNERLGAFATATTLLANGGWQAMPICEMLAPTLRAAAGRIDVGGPDLALSPQAAQNLALAVHELWTNAVKHGALAGETGRVALDWTLDDGRFVLTWRESGGRPVKAPERKGFGRQLLETIIPSAVDGEASMAFDEAGFVYALRARKDAVIAP